MSYTIPDIQGFMGDTELQWLYETAQKMDSIVEIGCWRGKSTHALLSGCRGPVYAVDHFHGSPDQVTTAHADAKTQDIYAQFLGHVGQFPNLVVHRMDSIEAARRFQPKSIDMVFIDGCHTLTAVLADLAAWRPICKKLLCGHDIGQDGVRPALQSAGVNYRNEVGSIWSHGMEGGKSV